MNKHRIFGLTLASDFDFATKLAPGSGAPTLTFNRTSSAPVAGGWEDVVPAYASPYRTSAGESRVCLYRSEGLDVLRFAGLADFYLWPDHIVCHAAPEVADALLEICFLGAVLSFWLECQGVPTLHASAVVSRGRAVAFLSSNKGGKTSLAAALLPAGCSLLTDDILALERRGDVFVGRPGYPQMRMWPEEASHFLGGFAGLESVHPELNKLRVPVGDGWLGEFCADSQPLSRIYIPSRRSGKEVGDRVEVQRLPPAAALIELVRNSFTGRIVEGLGQQERRLGFFADLVVRVPVCRLVYPSGLRLLPVVGEAVLRDVQASDG